MKTTINKNFRRTVAILALCLPMLMMVSCSNKSKMTGKWQITAAYLYDADIDSTFSEVARAMDKTYSGSDDYKKLKKIQDSVLKIRDGIQDAFKKCVYEFKSDGTVEIQTPKDPIKGTWDLQNGGEHKMYIDINKDGKLFERWQMYDDVFSIGMYSENKKIMMKINNGGSFDNRDFQIQGEALKM